VKREYDAIIEREHSTIASDFISHSKTCIRLTIEYEYDKIRMMEMNIRKLHDPEPRSETKKRTPEENLDLLELLRLEAGKFLYEYPTRFRRVFTVIGKK
jgi:hypothetical protein